MSANTKTLAEAAQAVLDRWDSPQWEWTKHGPTADLMHDLRGALDEQAKAQDVTQDGPDYGPAWLGVASARVMAQPGIAAKHLRDYAELLKAQAQADPYGWAVSGLARPFYGEFAEQDARAEARRCGGTSEAFPLYRHSAQPERQPLTRERVKQIMEENGYYMASPQERSDFVNGLRHGESAHGIGAKG